jgi:hypothetical protein
MTQTTETVTKAPAARALDDIMTVGKAWARYGLTVGKMALETSATTLSKTASWLGDLAQTLARQSEARADGKDASEDRSADTHAQ